MSAHDDGASRERTRGILKTRAAQLARESTQSALPQEHLEIVAFMLGSERYGIEACNVREVSPLRELTVLPGAPPFVLGIVKVRGQILSVIDVRRLFDLPQRGVGDRDRVIVLQRGELVFGILANLILGVLQIPAEGLKASLPALPGLHGEYLKGVTSDRLAILDAARLLSDESIIVREDA
jgi:purine-binding chemotaxis protein CheW